MSQTTPPPPSGGPTPPKLTTKEHLRRTFLTGLLFLVPVVVTGAVLIFVLEFLDRFLGPALAQAIGFKIPGLGIVATLLLVYLIGLVASNVAGKRLIALWEQFVTRVPLVSGVYKVSKEVSMAFQRDRRPFRQVVLVEFPRKNLWTMAFVTADVPKDGPPVPPGMVYLFIPTTPNPTSGWLILAPEEELLPTPYSVDEGMRIIISAGIVGPPGRPTRSSGIVRKEAVSGGRPSGPHDPP